MTAGYRIKTWRRWEVMEQKLPGEWDAVHPERGTIDDEVNAWLSANNIEPARVGYSCMPVGVEKATGRTTYLHTLVVTFIPREHVHDARNQAQVVESQTENYETISTVAAAFQPAVDFDDRPPDDAIRIDGPSELSRVAELFNLPALEVHRAYAEAAGSGGQIPYPHGGRPAPDGPHRGGQPRGGHSIPRQSGGEPGPG